MKIISIFANYPDFTTQNQLHTSQKPIFYLKPDSSLLLKNRDFYIPDFTQEIHASFEVVVKINRLGKNIAERFVHKYYEEITLGINFTAQDVLLDCKKNTIPWDIATSFDGSMALGQFISKNEINNINAIPFSLQQNEETIFVGNTQNMVHSINQIIAYISQFMTLKIGDFIFMGSSYTVNPIKTGDIFDGYINDKKLIHCEIK